MKLLKMVEHPQGDKNYIRLTDIAFPFGRQVANDSNVYAPTTIVLNGGTKAET
jgi:hypothetical protein